jgi:hypothetical protein
MQYSYNYLSFHKKVNNQILEFITSLLLSFKWSETARHGVISPHSPPRTLCRYACVNSANQVQKKI